MSKKIKLSDLISNDEIIDLKMRFSKLSDRDKIMYRASFRKYIRETICFRFPDTTNISRRIDSILRKEFS